MPVNDNQFLGWPFVNHAMEVRGTQTERGAGRQTIVYPRKKFTYVVEFAFNERALDPNRMETNLLEHIKNGRLYATLKSIDHPKPVFQSEKLRSYNKHVIVPTKVEYQPASMMFHDDNSSIAAALWKEIRAFYHYEGKIGSNAIRSNAPNRSLIDEYRQGNALTGQDVRSDTQNKPSLGMRLKEDDGRHFFDSIIIYDLGADPDSVNVYSFIYPFVQSLEHDGLDYEDRSGHVGIGMTFDYEGYYQLVGVNNAQFHQILEQHLGIRPITTSPSVQGHARMTPPNPNQSIPTSLLSSTLLSGLSSIVETESSIGPTGFNPSTVFPINPPSPITTTVLPPSNPAIPDTPASPEQVETTERTVRRTRLDRL